MGRQSSPLKLTWSKKIQSLSNTGDDTEFNFFFIDEFHIDTKQSFDVYTFALRKFFQGEHAKINLDRGFWINSCIACDVSERELSDALNGNIERNEFHKVVPTLINGFFQDAALGLGYQTTRML